MSAAFDMLPQETIQKWLKSCVGGKFGEKRDGVTLTALAQYMELPLNSLTCYVYAKNFCMSPARQRFFSKIIAMVENGQLDFKLEKGKKVAVLIENPRPIVRYQPVFAKGGVRLATTLRPRPLLNMPKFKDAVLK